MVVKVESAVAAAYAALKSQANRINELNVYPVPDGDTGTNMLLTLESIMKEVSGKSYENAERAAQAVARAALMGARGNSGVILSQIIRGACDILGSVDKLDAGVVASAFARAKERAYTAMRDPVEGTMLTVIKDAAEAAAATLKESQGNLPMTIRAAVQAAHASVKRSPELLEVLRDAGVVDAGGAGVAVIMDGILAYITGEDLKPTVDGGNELPDAACISGLAEEAWGYCTEFIVTGFQGDVGTFQDHIHKIGKSVLVIPQEDLVKVHLHTQDPGYALSYSGGFGRLNAVKVDDMEAQARQQKVLVQDGQLAVLGVVAVSRGDGNKELFESMGAVVVDGGQSNNPSAADLAAAVESMGSKEVVLLPNNKNILLTAQHVEQLVQIPVHVIETTNIAQGLAVMVGFDPEGEPEAVLEEMREILEGLSSGEITCSVREARVNGWEIPEGAYLGFLDGRLEVVEDSIETSAVELAGRLLRGGADALMLLRGEELDVETARRILEAVQALDPEAHVELKYGGQTVYQLQMVAE